MKARYYWNVLAQAIQLDILDLAYEFSSEQMNTLAFVGFWGKKNGLPRKGIAIRIGIFFWHFYQRVIESLRRGRTSIPSGGFVFFALSKNEVDSLRPVYSHIQDACLTGHQDTPFPFPFGWAQVLACPFFPLVVFHWLKAKGYQRRSFAHVFDQYWLAYGMYIVARAWLDRIKPKAVITCNEAYTYHRVMLKAARDQAIPTVHMQHSTNPDHLPPLTHEYALLEGEDNLRKVGRCGVEGTRIFLVGMPKHDAHFPNLNVQKQVRSVGLCTTILDPLDRAEALLARMRQRVGALPITIRPHNADIRLTEWRDLARRYDLEFSDSKTELAFNFLKSVDAIIAGDSNILLEAALMNVVPLYYDYSQSHLDWYGFQRNGLAEYFSEADDLCDRLEELARLKPDIRLKAKFYCDTLGTYYDGRSGELAAAVIQSIGSGNGFDRSLWSRIPGNDLEAYQVNNGRHLE